MMLSLNLIFLLDQFIIELYKDNDFNNNNIQSTKACRNIYQIIISLPFSFNNIQISFPKSGWLYAWIAKMPGSKSV